MKGKEKNGLSTKALMGVQVNYGKLRYCGRDENSWWVKRPVGNLLGRWAACTLRLRANN